MSHEVWKCFYQMTVRIQESFCPLEPAELVKFSTYSFAELQKEALFSVTNLVCIR